MPSGARPIVKVSLRDFEARKQEIAKELWRAATDVGFFCAPRFPARSRARPLQAV